MQHPYVGKLKTEIARCEAALDALKSRKTRIGTSDAQTIAKIEGLKRKIAINQVALDLNADGPRA